jgi:hypothetical protein
MKMASLKSLIIDHQQEARDAGAHALDELQMWQDDLETTKYVGEFAAYTFLCSQNNCQNNVQRILWQHLPNVPSADILQRATHAHGRHLYEPSAESGRRMCEIGTI